MSCKKNKIIFVSPPILQEELYGDLTGGGSTEALLGICYLAAVTRQKGYPTEIVDVPALNLSYEDAVNYILSKNPKYVGFTAVTLTIDNAAKLAKMLKEHNPSIITLIGGSHLTAVPFQTLQKYNHFDIGVIGEGEETIIQLLNAIEQTKDLSNITGIVFRKNGEILITERSALIKDIDCFPIPAWDLLPDIRRYYKPSGYAVNRLPSFSIVTSRGCCYKCIFCDRSVFGNLYRKHSPEYIVSMIKNLHSNYGIRDIRINDDEFMLDRNHVKNVCQKILDEKLDVTWSCLGRVDHADLELLKLMKRAGCWQIRYGIESGSQKILNIINKKITLSQVEQAIELTRQAAIKTIGFFMMGLPGETEDDLIKTINFALKLKLDDFKINFLAPYPGSQLYNEIEKYGQILLDDWSQFHMHKKPSFIPYDLNEEILIKYNRLAFRKFYMRPRIILSHMLRIRNMRSFMAKFNGFLSLFRYTVLLPIMKKRRIISD